MGSDCHTLKALKGWRHSRHEQIKVFVPKAFQPQAFAVLEQKYKEQADIIAKETRFTADASESSLSDHDFIDTPEDADDEDDQPDAAKKTADSEFLAVASEPGSSKASTLAAIPAVAGAVLAAFAAVAYGTVAWQRRRTESERHLMEHLMQPEAPLASA